MARRRRVLTSASAPAAGERGITLIELLVVVVILAFGAAVVVWNAPPARPPAKEAADEFAKLVAVATEEAVTLGADYRIVGRPGAYALEKREDGTWIAETTRDLPTRPLIAFKLDVDDAAADNALALNGRDAENEEAARDVAVAAIDPLGIAPDFTASFESRRGTWRVLSRAGALTVERD
ncbi:MAG: Tfp pilus assembly protein FimT/FimU [Parvularculaceae bacterium]